MGRGTGRLNLDSHRRQQPPRERRGRIHPLPVPGTQDIATIEEFYDWAQARTDIQPLNQLP